MELKLKLAENKIEYLSNRLNDVEKKLLSKHYLTSKDFQDEFISTLEEIKKQYEKEQNLYINRIKALEETDKKQKYRIEFLKTQLLNELNK